MPSPGVPRRRGETLEQWIARVSRAGGTMATLNDAPSDSKTYGRKNGAWSEAPPGVPVGGIIGWSGTLVSCPTGWAVCNGTDNAPGPDLTASFIT